jgi:hypothetical protein
VFSSSLKSILCIEPPVRINLWKVLPRSGHSLALDADEPDQRVMSLTRDGPLNTERARKRIIHQLSISTYVWLVLNRNRVAEDTNRSNTVPPKSQFCVILVRILVKYSNFWAISEVGEEDFFLLVQDVPQRWIGCSRYQFRGSGNPHQFMTRPAKTKGWRNDQL